MQGSRVPIRLWLAACWQMTQAKPGVSATSFSRLYGVPYNTSWTLLHKIRSAMDQAGRDRLSGSIEIDETWVGGREEGGRGKGSDRKSVVIVACEVLKNGQYMGRVRLQRVPDAGTLSIEAFIETYIEPGSVLYSDGNQAYVLALNRLSARGLTYKLDQTVLLGNPAPMASLLMHVHRVISLFKRWQLGTFQGAARAQHLDGYLGEFTFRFNRRSSKDRGLLFYRLVCALTEQKRAVRYYELRSRLWEQEEAERVHAQALKVFHKQRRSEKNHEAYLKQKAAAAGEEPPPQLKPELTSIADIEAF